MYIINPLTVIFKNQKILLCVKEDIFTVYLPPNHSGMLE